MCCFDCCDDFCEDFCEDCELPVDGDDLEEIYNESKQDYQIMGVTFFSRCCPQCVGEYTTYAGLASIFCMELGSFVLMSVALHFIIYRPDFDFGRIKDINWNSDDCPYSRSILKDAYDWSEVLLPLHATLLCVGAFFACCMCKPWKGPLFGCCCRYPFAICVFVYSWLLFSVFNNLSNSDCISTDDPNYDRLYDRFDRLSEWSLRLSLFYSTIMLCMFPTIAACLFTTYKCCALPRHCRNCCFQNCLVGHPYCVRLCFCCVPMDMRMNGINNHNHPGGGGGRGGNVFGRNRQHSTDLNASERKKLVKTETGNCPLCLDTDVLLVLTRGCKHGCCVTCLRGYIQANLKDLSKYPMSCFQHKCGALMAYTAVEFALDDGTSEGIDSLQTYDNMIAKSVLNAIEQITCPNCEAVMVKPRLENGRSTLMNCVNESCGTALCAKCGVRWHTDQTCEEFQKAIRERDEDVDEKFQELISKEKLAKCPDCGLVVERTEGCYHMTHYGCPLGDNNRCDFCYFCNERLMQMDGEGWRYSKRTQTKHFMNGVYAPCIVEEKSNANGSSSDDDFDDDDDVEAGRRPSFGLW